MLCRKSIHRGYPKLLGQVLIRLMRIRGARHLRLTLLCNIVSAKDSSDKSVLKYVSDIQYVSLRTIPMIVAQFDQTFMKVCSILSRVGSKTDFYTALVHFSSRWCFTLSYYFTAECFGSWTSTRSASSVKDICKIESRESYTSTNTYRGCNKVLQWRNNLSHHCVSISRREYRLLWKTEASAECDSSKEGISEAFGHIMPDWSAWSRNEVACHRFDARTEF